MVLTQIIWTASNDAGFDMTKQDHISYNRYIAVQAHTRGLSVGLKNGPEMIYDLVAYIHFSVNEQCTARNEWEMLQLFINVKKPVFNVEYDSAHLQNPEQTSLCNAALSQQFSTLILPSALMTVSE